MGKDYWLERWEQKETGFHQSDTNPYLCQHWKELYLDQGDTVFVPLCGKSQDISWLYAQNYKVLGIELSIIAVEDFFKENKLVPTYNCCKRFDRYETNRICILRGDFFNLNKKDLIKVVQQEVKISKRQIERISEDMGLRQTREKKQNGEALWSLPLTTDGE